MAKAKPKPKQRKPTTKSKAKAKPKLEPPKPTSEKQAQFLASILENPDDKKARLVYADLLQDQGDPRGAFIVMQCTRADLADDDPRIAELDQQIDALLAKHKKAWTALGENKGARWEFRRGFVEKLSIDAKDLLANADLIFAAEPIEELNIWKIAKLAPLLALPLGRIRRLSLARCPLKKDDFAALGKAKTLGNVELLDLTNGGSAQIPIAALGKATSLPKLVELRVGGCMMGDKAMAELAKSKTLRFKRLVAFRNDFDQGACEAIANAEWAPYLEHLDLSSNEIMGDPGLRWLAESSKLTALKTVKLDYCGFGDTAADMLLSSPVFARIEKMEIPYLGGDYDRVKAVFGDRLA